MGLHVDLEAIYLDNRAKTDVVRKNGLVINTGDNPTKQEIHRKREANKKKYGLSADFVRELQLPKTQTKEWLKVLTLDQIFKESSNFSCMEKLTHLEVLLEALERKLQKTLIREDRLKKKRMYRDCNVIVQVRRTVGVGIGSEMYEFDRTIAVKPKEV